MSETVDYDMTVIKHGMTQNLKQERPFYTVTLECVVGEIKARFSMKSESKALHNFYPISATRTVKIVRVQTTLEEAARTDDGDNEPE